jgi:hypothetical protein
MRKWSGVKKLILGRVWPLSDAHRHELRLLLAEAERVLADWNKAPSPI